MRFSGILALANSNKGRDKLAKRTIILLVGVVALLIIATIFVLLMLREEGLNGSGVYFVRRGLPL